MQLQDFVKRLVEHMGIEAEIHVEETDELIQVQVTAPEEESGLLIGYHGEVLTSIQKILQAIYSREETSKRIVVNINDYRQRREKQLEEMLAHAIERVEETQQPYVFSFLSPHERRVIHELVSTKSEFAAYESFSVGERGDRRLQVRLKVA